MQLKHIICVANASVDSHLHILLFVFVTSVVVGGIVFLGLDSLVNLRLQRPCGEQPVHPVGPVTAKVRCAITSIKAMPIFF